MNHNRIIIVLVIIFVIISIAGIILLNPTQEKTQSVINITSSNELNIGDKFSISLTNTNGTPIENQTVNITLTNSNSEKIIKQVTTNNEGKGEFDLNEISSGQYTVNVTYEGNDKYSNTTASQQLTIREKIVQTKSTVSKNDDNYYNGYSRSDFGEGEQAAIDDARAHGYSSPAEYYHATGKTAGQSYLDAHPLDKS